MDARLWHRLVAIAENETAHTAEQLPAELRAQIASVPVTLEPQVSDDLVATGVEPDLLGLFVGEPHNLTDSLDPMAPQIFLFLESIWHFAEANEEVFREEIRTTYLHELGHYLGLDEEDLEKRGLD